MLSLIGIEKEYRTGGQSVKALDGVLEVIHHSL